MTTPQGLMPGFNFHSFFPNFTLSLICLPIHFHLIFVLLFSIWLLTLSLNFTLSQVGFNISTICTLNNIQFQFCAIKCYALQYVWIFTHFITNHNSLSFFALLTSWSTVCKGSVFLQFCGKIQSNIYQIFTRCIQQFLLSHMESSMGFSPVHLK